MTRSRQTPGRRAHPIATAAVGVICALGAAGCGGGTGSPAVSGPSWTRSLGPHVTVVPPGHEHVGDGSPGALVSSYEAAANSGRITVLCQFVEPAGTSACDHALAGATSSNGARISHFALGYVAIDGNRALVGLTGTNCNPTVEPTCSTNTDPAAIFSSGRPFGALYIQAVASQNPAITKNVYSLAPCVRVAGRWYIEVPPNDF
jgi:hypothetical protein